METEPPALGERLIGRSTGFQGDIILPPEEAYGKRPSDEESIKIIPVEELNKDFPTEMTVEKGVMFHSEFKMPNGKQGQVLCTIVDIKDDQAILYLGNPLAGQTVRFAVEVLEVRDATEEDIRQLAERYAQPS
jgi:FKBP-type peptidyl-prolyl cis-trans isomerase SlyD